jgi:hypothetical protein
LHPGSRHLLLLWILPTAAWAHSVTDEVGFGSSPATTNNPSTGFLYDRLGGEGDINDHWDIRGDVMLTHDQAAPPQQGARFGSSGGNILFFDLGGDWQPDDHISFGLEGDFAPKSNQASDAQIAVAGPDGGSALADADLRTATSSLGFTVNVGLDTAGESNWESAGNTSLAVTHFSTDQLVAAVANRRTNFELPTLRTACEKAQTAGRAPISCAALLGEPGDITQSRVAANFTETLYEDTDVGLTGAYYIYDKDPTTVGYFTLATRGRVATGGSFAFGQGLAIAPYQFTVRPDVAHRFGGLRLDLSYQYGQYVPGQGYSNAVGLKADYKFNRAWKVWLAVILEKDTDGSGNQTTSGSVAAGVRFRF